MRSSIGLIAMVSIVLFVPILHSAEKPLTNADVASMLKAGLGDDVVISKIVSSREVALDVSTDALIQLKKSGVSSAVLDAMIRRSGDSYTPSSDSSAPAAAEQRQELKTGVRLLTSDKEYDLVSIAGSASSTYAYVTFLLWNNYPGQHAEIRTTDRQPSILIENDKSPVGRFYIVRLDSNPKSDDRSLKMGRAGMFTQRSSGSPDHTWTTPFETKPEGDGLWRITPKKPLPPDEYGLWMGTGELYDFAVE